MKKQLLFALSSLLIGAAQANPSYCGYKDFFHLSDTTNPGIQIINSYSDQDIILQQVGPRSFTLRDTEACRAGFAHVTIALDRSNWCLLDIKDGPYMSHPTVSASCTGLHYFNTKYDGSGTYSYSINIG